MTGKNIKAQELFIAYIAAQIKSMEEKQDKGALGKAIEVSVRLLLVGNWNLVHENMLKVAGRGDNDVTSRKLGAMEIGHNGKSWLDVPANKKVVYGMFSAEILRTIFKELVKTQDNTSAANYWLDAIARRMLVWDNWTEYERDFLQDMGAGAIRIVHDTTREYRDYSQTRYNDSKLKRWLQVKDNWNRPTFYDILQGRK